jgi:2-amino-4-hydroxy-6-hydroxymethyldihydropteridine diphosphokinase
VATVYLGFGSNLDDRLALLRAAVAAVAAQAELVALSSVYETEPWGKVDQPRFLNLCAVVRTQRSPVALHATLKAIERQLGREEGGRRWGPRRIDIDLLLYDDLVLSTPTLTIPHPRLAERAFVLAPLAEIAPTLRPPGLEATVAELLARLSRHQEVAWVVAPPTAVLGAVS